MQLTQRSSHQLSAHIRAIPAFEAVSDGDISQVVNLVLAAVKRKRAAGAREARAPSTPRGSGGAGELVQEASDDEVQQASDGEDDVQALLVQAPVPAAPVASQPHRQGLGQRDASLGLQSVSGGHPGLYTSVKRRKRYHFVLNTDAWPVFQQGTPASTVVRAWTPEALLPHQPIKHMATPKRAAIMRCTWCGHVISALVACGHVQRGARVSTAYTCSSCPEREATLCPDVCFAMKHAGFRSAFAVGSTCKYLESHADLVASMSRAAWRQVMEAATNPCVEDVDSALTWLLGPAPVVVVDPAHSQGSDGEDDVDQHYVSAGEESDEVAAGSDADGGEAQADEHSQPPQSPEL